MPKYILILKKIPPIFLIILGISIYTGLSFYHEKKQVLEETDRLLINSARNIKYYLGEDYITENMDEKTYSKEEIVQKGSLLDDMAKRIGVDYFYIFTKKNSDIYYAIISETEEELRAHPTAYYWMNLKDAEDDSYDITWEAFEKNKPIFLNSSDIWGSYRSVYLPQISEDGTRYLVGVDITIPSLRKETIHRIIFSFVGSLIFFLSTLPFILGFKKLKKESSSIKNKINILEELDPLTGAYNRKTGTEIFEKIVKNSDENIHPFSVFIVDIKNLDHINKKMDFLQEITLLKLLKTFYP
jgi:hypothetical protein